MDIYIVDWFYRHLSIR